MKKLIISLLLMLSINPIFSVEQPRKTREELIQDFTNVMTALYQKLVDTNIITIEHLKKLERADRLISPLTQDERNGLSSDQLVRIKELEARLNVPVIMPHINGWARKTIIALTGEQATKERVHKETVDPYKSMVFVDIPAGTRVDEITHEAFEILPGIEIQDTPVTQWQWVQAYPEYNPSVFRVGPDSEEFYEYHGYSDEKKYNFYRPNAPVENVAYEPNKHSMWRSQGNIKEFIEKLNADDKEYIYALPSVREYQALMQSTLGKNWLNQISKMKRSEIADKTQSVLSGQSFEINGKRVCNLLGNTWQWTRDVVGTKESSENIVFGASFRSNVQQQIHIKDFLRPIIYHGCAAETIGFRLVRYKKTGVSQKRARYSYRQISWNEADSLIDQDWQWDEYAKRLIFRDDAFNWLILHKTDYPIEMQRTIGLLLNEEMWYPEVESGIQALKERDFLLLNSEEIDLRPIALLGHLTELQLTGTIKNLAPIAHLKNLKRLTLYDSKISNLDPLKRLENLYFLNLAGNMLKDLSPLEGLENLTHLYLISDGIEDIGSLAHISHLETLELRDNKIENINAFGKLESLISLNLEHNQIKDINQLFHLKQLRDLRLSHNQIQNINALDQLDQLEKIELYDNNFIEDFKPLSQLKNLKKILLDFKQRLKIDCQWDCTSGNCIHQSKLFPGVEVC